MLTYRFVFLKTRKFVRARARNKPETFYSFYTQRRSCIEPIIFKTFNRFRRNRRVAGAHIRASFSQVVRDDYIIIIVTAAAMGRDFHSGNNHNVFTTYARRPRDENRGKAFQTRSGVKKVPPE